MKFQLAKEHHEKWTRDDRFICKTNIISHGANRALLLLDFCFACDGFLLETDEACQ